MTFWHDMDLLIYYHSSPYIACNVRYLLFSQLWLVSRQHRHGRVSRHQCEYITLSDWCTSLGKISSYALNMLSNPIKSSRPHIKSERATGLLKIGLRIKQQILEMSTLLNLTIISKATLLAAQSQQPFVLIAIKIWAASNYRAIKCVYSH